MSDVVVSFLTQPIYTAFPVSLLQLSNPSCKVYRMLEIFRALFLIVVAVSVGRFLAAHLHLIHQSQEIMTHSRVVTAVIAIWVPSVDSSTTTLLGPLFSQKGVFWCYKRISMSPFWFIPRSVYPFNGTRITFSSCVHSLKLTLVRRLIFRFLLTESAIIIFYVYAIFNFWVCYFPFFISVVAISLSGSSIDRKNFTLSS